MVVHSPPVAPPWICHKRRGLGAFHESTTQYCPFPALMSCIGAPAKNPAMSSRIAASHHHSRPVRRCLPLQPISSDFELGLPLLAIIRQPVVVRLNHLASSNDLHPISRLKGLASASKAEFRVRRPPPIQRRSVIGSAHEAIVSLELKPTTTSPRSLPFAEKRVRADCQLSSSLSKARRNPISVDTPCSRRRLFVPAVYSLPRWIPQQ
ncbi:hypothetical protein Cob_v007857 [Colletotrichum orbiculare MAFF 240422]|uniref:Uncharacterized protein n=1 Tax=Colletotrichum orbiculare (strain 104-T / ATCC 96160 / CBS 514.97 / LARS 414 / MAFF 240422) TaxID=1213857 RepID=A0A484FLM3_COLOR|nr:hypothetical protein Cob_v007857 [Colletotrichum orbiculare MAFF 240422]